jgi:hypothetical protein
MDPRTLPFLAAAAILIAVRIAMSWEERRHDPFFEPPSAELPRWNPGQLLLASFLTLFAELALIRWVAVEVRIFAYFKNLDPITAAGALRWSGSRKAWAAPGTFRSGPPLRGTGCIFWSPPCSPGHCSC